MTSAQRVASRIDQNKKLLDERHRKVAMAWVHLPPKMQN